MEHVFPFRDIEKKWQTIWQKLGIDKAKQDKEKLYILEMLPYPSGKLHMGHVRNYTIGDVIARYFKLQGKDIFHPIGWDSFGLPAENAAIDKGINPKDWTYKNIQDMKAQIQEFGLSYDWDTELATCSPEYYKWNQWLFGEMFKKGLAYKKYAKVNFCPSCQTVLANEQVINGRCWRCNSEVEMKSLSQWYLAITKYTEPLLSQHEMLRGHWPDRVLNMQQNWIGKSQGAEIDFTIKGYQKSIKIFTTKPETLFGVSFIALAPEHPFIIDILSTGTFPEIKDFVKEVQNQTEQDRSNTKTTKKGIFTGFFAVNPINNEELPIYIADFVLIEYGEGAIMGVPAHDQRDFEFAKQYSLPIKAVIHNPKHIIQEQTIIPPIGTLIDSGDFTGQTEKQAASHIIKFLESKGIGKNVIQYKLRDWLISRQRYWGTPIPIIYCDDCGPVLVEEQDLPVLLPTDIQFKVGENPILSSPTFLHAPCPKCGKNAKRETDTMDTFFDSSWYFMRYTDAKNDKAILNKQKSLHWLPVDYYIGGIEHAVLHLLYARFFYYVFEELGFVKGKEPFKNLITQGMVLSHSYYCAECKTYYTEQEAQNIICPKHKIPLVVKMEKMSKSKNNGVDPERLLGEYGADASRLFMMFAAPLDRDLEWNENGLMGCSRFLKRFYTCCYKYSILIKNLTLNFSFNTLNKEEKELLKKAHQTISKITQDMKDFSYNTVIAALMELLNHLEAFESSKEENILKMIKSILESFAIMLFPMAPHTAEECYALIGGEKSSIALSSFPVFNVEWTKEQDVTYAVQINGKLKLSLTTPVGCSQEEVETLAKSAHNIAKALDGFTIIKTIFVKGKIVNFVVKQS